MKEKKIPMRKCISCMESKPKLELIRISLYDDELVVDITGKAKGRGVYLCNNMDCVEQAKKKKAFQRAYKRNFDENIIDEVLLKVSDVIEKNK